MNNIVFVNRNGVGGYGVPSHFCFAARYRKFRKNIVRDADRFENPS